MGRLIGWADRTLNIGSGKKLKGALTMVALLIGAWSLGTLITMLPTAGLLDAILAAILFAQKSLTQHVASVADALRLSLPSGRTAVARIVGRDVTALDEAGISRAAIESAAENFSDGVIAPVFWFLLLGLPGLLVYKITNTADSMIGYMTPRHRAFGWAAARFDDLLNWVPARLTAGLFALVNGRFDAYKLIRRDAPLHRSPNAGWPEAAMAIVLNLALAGPRSYNSTMQTFPFVHPEGRRDARPDDIDAAVRALWRSWAAIVAALAITILICPFAS
jgi:adenosylcobinamide-phosphate synthase